MKMSHTKPTKSLKLQKGMTLIELLVAAVVSLIAVSGMVLVMASTLGTTTQTIEMTRLTHDMRTAMQIMTRELRRANYHKNWIDCYGNTGCLKAISVDETDTLVDITGLIKRIEIGNSVDTNDCFSFWYDRPQLCPTTSCTTAQLLAAQTAVTGESVAAFRRAVTDDVGRLQMTTIRTDAAVCNNSADWVDITDPNIIDVLALTITNADPDLPSILETINSALDTQNVEKIGLAITARLTADPSVPAWIQGNVNAERTMDEFVVVRNNITTVASP